MRAAASAIQIQPTKAGTSRNTAWTGGNAAAPTIPSSAAAAQARQPCNAEIRPWMRAQNVAPMASVRRRFG